MTTKNYLKAITQMERLYRLFLEFVMVELRNHELDDINNVQCILLYNIGMDKSGDLNSTEIIKRGYYLGTNVTYNLQKLIRSDYIVQKACLYDGRLRYIHLSDKGKKLLDKINKEFVMKLDDLIKHDNYSVVEDIRSIKEFCEGLVND